MQIVIDISKEKYNEIMSMDWVNCRRFFDEEILAIHDGKVLPKGHGRLIDADKLNRKDLNCANVPMNFIDIAPTIIEADKTESEADNIFEYLTDEEQNSLWIYMIFNIDNIKAKTEQWTKEAEKRGMTLTEYLESINPLNEANKIDVIKDIFVDSEDKE